MSGWRLYSNWQTDLPGLTVGQLHERRDFAAERSQHAAARGMGRNPKATRDWREKLCAVEDELLRRGAGEA
jgi:hypothetical protein